ncbi:MAG: membrane protein insertase YidC [Aerococcus sp.]|nr:membrane protein insertase YidC [Aerococcus sp.]
MNTKKHSKKVYVLLLITLLVFVLAGCASNRTTMPMIDENSTGFWNHTILYNLQQIIIAISNFFGGHYAIGIVVFTIIIRTLLIPLYQYQQKSTNKMQAVQPKMNELREKYSSQDLETQQKFQAEIKKLQDEAGYNPWLSFLPLIIQLPILTAVYQAIVRSPELTQGSFLWMNLGERDPFFILPLVTAGLTWYNSHLIQIQTGNTGGTVKVMQWVMPVFIFFITFGLASAISLYMVTTNAFSVVQTLVLNNPFKKQREREEEEARKKDLERRLRKARRRNR